MKHPKLFLIITILIVALLVQIFFTFQLNAENTNTDSLTPGNDSWRLTVTGLVDNPLNLTLTEIKSLPNVTENATLFCVDFPGNPVAQGNWTGVPLPLLLEMAGISPSAVKVAFYAKDGYATDLTIKEALRDDIIVAYENNGAALNQVLRLVVPGKWGYKWITLLTTIEVVNYDFYGKWESRGYSDQADITSGISAPGIPKVPLGTATLSPSPTQASPSVAPTPTPTATQPAPTATPSAIPPTPTSSELASPTATTQLVSPTPTSSLSASPSTSPAIATPSNTATNSPIILYIAMVITAVIILAVVAMLLSRKGF